MKNNLEEVFAAEAMPHLQDLYRTAVRLTRDQAQAEDIVQEVFLQAWKSFDDYESGTNCRAWLYKIMFFKISHHRRNLAMNAKIFQSDDEEGTLFAATASQEIPQHLTDEGILAAVDNLPAHQRAVILLADVQEFSYKEVAQILQIPIGTVMSRLNRARAGLRETLSGAAQEYGVIKAMPAKSSNQVSPAPQMALCAA